MKKQLPIILFSTMVVFGAQAQNDTLLYENFDVDPTASYVPFNSGNDLTWVNFDADALADANGRPQDWFWSEAGFADADTLDGCLFSSSWLTGFLPGNRNWLMTPPIQIADASAVLSWKSAPRQTPLYVDGYSVLISTTDNIETSFTDVAFQAGQYLSGSGSNFGAYTFSPGFVHGQDGTFIQFDATADSSRLIGEQRPFSVSLSQYAGQTIYIAFLHDADDDNLISLDDILITGTLTSVNDLDDKATLSVYPNPAADKIELSYFLDKSTQVYADIFDSKGSKVKTVTRGLQIAGSQKMTIDVTDLSSGLYNVVLYMNNKNTETKFLKN